MFLQNAIVSVFSSLNKYFPISSCDLSTLHLPNALHDTNGKDRSAESLQLLEWIEASNIAISDLISPFNFVISLVSLNFT